MTEKQDSASAMSVATVAQERAARLLQDVILRDALIIDLKEQVTELEHQLAAVRNGRPTPPVSA